MTMRRYLLFLLLICNNQTKPINDLPAPYCDMQELLPFVAHGWYDHHVWMQNLFKNNNITTAIEVGSWLGKSTRHIASLLPENGYVFAVDTWLGSYEHHQWESCKRMLPTLYQQFLSNVLHCQLAHKIIPIRMTSLEASKVLESNIGKIDLVYLDAAHDTKSVSMDLYAYFPYVANRHGIICGDDWKWETVQAAVIPFAQKHNLSLYYGENFWFLKEEGSFKVETFIQKPDSVWLFEYKQ